MTLTLAAADYARLLTDPYAMYPQLRAAGAPIYAPALDAWLLVNYADVDAATRHPMLARSLAAQQTPAERQADQRARNWHDMPNHEAYVQFSLLEDDGAVHERLRLLLLGHFTRTFVARYGPVIEKLVAAQLEPLLGAGVIDFIADLAAPLPGRVIARVLGVADADADQLRQWSEDIVQFFDADRTPAHKTLAEASTTAFADYLKLEINARRRAPRDDLLSLLTTAEVAGQLSQQELISTAMLILMAGNGSTIDALGTGLLASLRHPQQLTQLRRDPTALGTAVLEMMRYESPLPYFHRLAREPVTLAGKRWDAGTRFGLLYGAANRDPAAFDDPDRFDCRRQPNRHLAFGRGIHLCLGNHLSQLVMRNLFAQLLSNTRDLAALDATPDYRPGLTARGLRSLRLALTPV
ncbi:MAG: cytochrome P450 [Pseudomonadota bacterium]